MRVDCKQEVAHLVRKYNEVVSSKRIDGYNEEMTKKDFILPLFRSLGWDVENSMEVTAEERVSKKKVDYGFRIDGVPKFYQLTLSSAYLNYVGPMIPFVADPNGPPPPDPPPPWAPWYFNASDMRGYLYDANSNPYTGSYIIQILNETSQMYQTYDSTSPSTDYVIYGENTAGFIGYYTRGFKLTMPVSGCSIRCIVPW